MGGRVALSVSARSGMLEGCTLQQSQTCRELVRTLVRCAGAVIVGRKPAAVFSLSLGCSDACLRGALAAYERELPNHGIRLVRVGRKGRRTMLLVYRMGLVGELLACAENRRFLLAYGLPIEDAHGLMRALAARLARYHAGASQSFPHEIGLVLGYPLEDVVGYLHGGEETCRGPWRAYGDEDVARNRFDVLRRCEQDCCRRFEAGGSLAELIA